MQQLLEAGADPAAGDAQGSTALCLAAVAGHLDAVQWCLDLPGLETADVVAAFSALSTSAESKRALAAISQRLGRVSRKKKQQKQKARNKKQRQHQQDRQGQQGVGLAASPSAAAAASDTAALQDTASVPPPQQRHKAWQEVAALLLGELEAKRAMPWVFPPSASHEQSRDAPQAAAPQQASGAGPAGPGRLSPQPADLGVALLTAPEAQPDDAVTQAGAAQVVSSSSSSQGEHVKAVRHQHRHSSPTTQILAGSSQAQTNPVKRAYTCRPILAAKSGVVVKRLRSVWPNLRQRLYHNTRQPVHSPRQPSRTQNQTQWITHLLTGIKR